MNESFKDHIPPVKSKFQRPRALTRPKTAIKDPNSRITGDLSKIQLLQAPTFVKQVNFRPSLHSSISTSHLQRSTMNSRLNVTRIKPTRPKVIRPQTAKNYYTESMLKIKQKSELNRVFPLQHEGAVRERVIEYANKNESDKDLANFNSMRKFENMVLF